MKRLPIIIGLAAALAVGVFWLAGGRVICQEEKKEEEKKAEAKDEQGGEGKVESEVAVHVGQIMTAKLHAYVVAYGTVELEPSAAGKTPASVRIAPPVAGIVSKIECADGQRVAKGTTLFRLDSRLADLAVEKAKEGVEFANKNLDRQKNLQKVEGTSAKLFQEAEQQLKAAQSELAAAQAQRDLLKIDAPIAGVIAEISVKPGEAVDGTKILASLNDLSRLVVTANVPSAELPLIKAGLPVEIIASRAAPGNGATTETIHQGTLAYIGSQIDAKTDSATVRVAIASNGELRPGQFVKIRVAYEEHPGRLVVPEASVVANEEGQSVISVVEGEKAVQKPVKTGLRENGMIEVEGEGLSEGTAIVIEDAYGLPKETKIKRL